ncbi:MAG: lysylphosphatidylglycerol synthase domain-containing protein, partial [Myxococcota bacterium]
MLRAAQIVFLVGLVLASAWWLVADLDWATVRDTLASTHPGYLLGVCGLLAINHVARSLRLQALVRAPVAAWDLLRISAVSFLAIQVLPLRLGEFVRPQLLVRHGVSFGEGVGAVAVDRILDVLMLLGFLALVAFAVPLPAGAIEVGGVDLVAAGQRAGAV